MSSFKFTGMAQQGETEMFRKTLISGLLFVVFATLSKLSLAQQPATAPLARIPKFAPDRILVKFNPGTAASDIVLAHQLARGQPLKMLPQVGVHVIKVPAASVLETVALYQKNPNVEYAEPDYFRLLVIPNEEPFPAQGSNLFNDQWYLQNSGDPFLSGIVPGLLGGATLVYRLGTQDADIDAPTAWNITTGSARVKIAVLDTGIDCNTAELASKCESVKYDFIDYMSAPGINDTCSGSDPACDNNGHGTFVASLAASDTNNSEGIAGIGWNTRVGAFKVCYNALVTDGINIFNVGLCPVSNSISGITAAADSGYHAISMSYGSDLIDPAGNISPTSASTAECAAVEYAVNSGVSVIAAAGNNADNNRVFPAACRDASGNSTVIAVAASDPDDFKAGFSTWSRSSDDWVSIAAPGQYILGVLPDAQCGISPGSDTCIDIWDGTSMAAPLVSGVAALVWDYLYTNGVDGGGAPVPSCASGGATPCNQCTVGGVPCNQVVRARLESGADKIGALGQNLLLWTAHGRLNAENALADSVCVSTESPEVSCSDGIDNDCDGSIDDSDLDCSVDADGDGFPASNDCDDANSAIYPTAIEHCSDGIDNNCNGAVDGDDPMCIVSPPPSSGLPKGDSCSADAECASNKCTGRSGRKTCN